MKRGDIIVNPWVSVDYCGELNPMYVTIYLGNNYSLDYKGRKHKWADKVYKENAEHKCPWKVIGHIDIDSILETAIREAVQTANDIFKEKTEAYIREKVDAEFAKPVKKDDGWGEVEYYDSFEEFVRKTMQSRLSNNWDFRREVERKIEKTIDNAKKRVAQKVAETDFVDEVLAELKPKDFQL